MDELKRELMEAARAGGICAEGYGLMRCYDRDELIEYYLKVPDWGLKRGFPTLETLRREFSHEEHNGVYVDKTFDGEILGDRQTYVFHHCSGRAQIEMGADGQTGSPIIPMLYFANGCDMRVECLLKYSPKIKVPCYIFGNDEHLTLRGGRGAEFIRYKTRTQKK